MTKFSQRSQELALSPIRKLARYADAAEAKGNRVFYLNIGQPDIQTPPQALQKLREAPIDILKYSPSLGTSSYRNKLPQYFQRFGIAVKPEDIMITTGASEAIFLCLMATMDPGDEIIIPEPFYANYLGFAAMAGVKVVPVTSYLEDAFALPPIAAIEDKITAKTRAILLCNPNNPTGCVYAQEILAELGEVVKAKDLYLIVDEVYREFVYDAMPFCSALQIEGLEEQAIVIDSISKRYSACGARVGSIVSRNPQLLDTLLKYAQFRLSSPGLGQILAEAAIDLEASYLEGIKAEYDRRRQHLYRRLSAISEVHCYLPEGAFYLFARLPIDNADRFCQWLLEDFSHHQQTVMLSPGSGFYASPGLGENEIRIAYVLNTEDLDKAMDCLEIALQQYPGRQVAPLRQTLTIKK